MLARVRKAKKASKNPETFEGLEKWLEGKVKTKSLEGKVKTRPTGPTKKTARKPKPKGFLARLFGGK